MMSPEDAQKVAISPDLLELIINTIVQHVPYSIASALLERVDAEFAPPKQEIIKPH